MFQWSVALLSAIIMLGLEYLVLVRIYEKNPNIEWGVAIIPPLLLIAAQYITYMFQDRENAKRDTLNPFILLVVFVILKLPFSLTKQDVVPQISLLERLAIVSAEAISATIIAEGIVVLFRKE
jgi:hypothetical protein